MSGDILTAYENRFGGATGWLGFPAGAAGKNAPGDPFQDFERGVLVRHIAPGRPFDGVQAFGELSFLFDRLRGHGSDCTLGACGDLEVQADLSIDRSFGDPIRVHYDEFENEKTFNDRRLVFDRAKSTFRATAKIEAWEYDDGPRDHMGTTTQEYSIDNLWGLEISPKHGRPTNGADSRSSRPSIVWRRPSKSWSDAVKSAPLSPWRSASRRAMQRCRWSSA